MKTFFLYTIPLFLVMFLCISCLKTVSPDTQATSAEQAGAMRELLNVSVDTSCLRLSQAKQINSTTGYNGNIDVEIPFTSFVLTNQALLSANGDRKSTRLNSSHRNTSRMPSSA